MGFSTPQGESGSINLKNTKISFYFIFSIEVVGHIYGLFMGSPTPQGELFNFNPVLSKLHDVELRGEGGRGIPSREAGAKFFLGILMDTGLVSDLWAVCGLFRYATDDHWQSTVPPQTDSTHAQSFTTYSTHNSFFTGLLLHKHGPTRSCYV